MRHFWFLLHFVMMDEQRAKWPNEYFRVVHLASGQLCHDNSLHTTLVHSISPIASMELWTAAVTCPSVDIFACMLCSLLLLWKLGEKLDHQKEKQGVDLASTNDTWCHVAPRGYRVVGTGENVYWENFYWMSTVLTLDTSTIVIRSSCEINLLISQAAVGLCKTCCYFYWIVNLFFFFKGTGGWIVNLLCGYLLMF